jgi:hypothetical protein
MGVCGGNLAVDSVFVDLITLDGGSIASCKKGFFSEVNDISGTPLGGINPVEYLPVGESVVEICRLGISGL